MKFHPGLSSAKKGCVLGTCARTHRGADHGRIRAHRHPEAGRRALEPVARGTSRGPAPARRRRSPWDRPRGSKPGRGGPPGSPSGKAELLGANLEGADLREAEVLATSLVGVNLQDAKLLGADFHWSRLIDTDLRGAELQGANLRSTTFVGTKLKGAKLRALGFVPMLFDFKKPKQRDFTETVKTLVGLSRFVVADITNPKSSPLELQASVPDYLVPFVPIQHEDEQPFSMFVDLQTKYDWVLPVLKYDTTDNLIRALEAAVVRPALEMSDRLLARRAESIRVRHVSGYG
ncbi:MAG: pentapeptide repeat-containing protein [Vicinamibacterales bacterium]